MAARQNDFVIDSRGADDGAGEDPMTHRPPTFPLFASLLLAACGGSTHSNRSQGTPDASPDVAVEASADDGCTPGNAPGTELFTCAQVQAALAHCGDADAAQLSPTPPTVAGFRALLEGAWVLCPGSGAGSGAEVFTTHRTSDLTVELYDWYNLLPDPKGGLVRGVGVDDTGSYGIGAQVLFMPPDAGDSAPIQMVTNVDVYTESGGDGALGPTFFEMNMPVRMITYTDPKLVWQRLGDAPP
jgi:hypothetical protein